VKKNYKAKSWFSLEDAAARLSSGLGEEITVQNVLELVIEGHLPISWYARQAFAQVVVSAEEGWRVLDEADPIRQLDGPYRLALEHCGALKDWIHSSLSQTGGELASDGFFVSDAEEQILQIMAYYEGQRYRVKNQWSRMEGSYRPSMKFPHESELVIQREDIDTFERSIGEAVSHKTRKWTPQMQR
jgi:hypothetical protein|tara:strand:- start:90 stop:650 length:561 start_codon:yes stop_codon:yes gene_type:complete